MCRGGSRDFEKGWYSMSTTTVGRQRKFYVSDGLKKGQNNVRNYKFLAKYFQIFSIFIYNESLPMKSYQFFKICKRFDKEREKNTYAAVNERRKTKKSWTLFYNRLFYKVL